MFNQTRLQEALTAYKKDFVAKQWKNEKYKWEAVKWFQDNWDINAYDFAEMLEHALGKTGNLLSSAGNFPAKMIIELSRKHPKDVRAMFRALFDETTDVFERIEAFKEQSRILLKKTSDRDIHHFQTENAISIYLWLNNPNKYYIYKLSEVKNIAAELESTYQFKKGAYKENINNFMHLYDEINAIVKEDTGIVKLLQSQLTETCYPDPELKTLTVDIGFYISRHYNRSTVVTTKNNERTPHYWLYAPGRDAEKWDEFYASGIMGLGWDEVGDLSSFPSKKAINEKMQQVYEEGASYKNSAHMTWLFSHEIKPGDIVFVKKGRMGTILGRGIIQSDYTFDATRNAYKNILRVKWTHKGDWTIPDTMFPMKTLTDITPYNDLVSQIRELFEEDYPDDRVTIYPPYTKEDFIHEVYMNKSQYASLAALLKKKKNIILQGAPGVGKTFVSKRLAYSLMSEKDTERVMLVQFHQSYSYEDFIMGYRPTKENFEIHTGAFYDFCKKAADDNENDYYCIIDEINRGNLNKIFGELFMLLEADKRGKEVRLLYKDENFSVPPNLYLIGTMNTADRSLAMLDYALRRRFSFFEILPGFDTDGFQSYQKELSSEKFDNVIRCIKDLNDTIAKDETLGEGFCIGHSYFCGLTKEELNAEVLSSIVEYDIIPLIKEYWFDEPAKVRDWSERLRRALQ